MDRKQANLLDEIGGEPLEGSGFEDETPALYQEFDPDADQQEDEQ